ncbi:outer membrane protein assembly factor BamA [Primorskyibacter sp. S187A]|uniref:outer membrane protein assembly factor BamA n=1 Tax=Primorskyibacter sp. S187A TaxID=3415130 RepID=UPI003C7D9A69
MSMTKTTGATKAARTRGFLRNTALASAAAAALMVTQLPAPAFAQNFAFNSVEIEGAQRIEPATILTYAGIARGERVSAGDLNDAYQRILGSGLFESVDLVPQGSTLVIRVVEFPTINRIAFEGNRRIKDEDLLPVIQSQSRRVFSASTAESDAQTISQAYAESGRLAARVTPRIIRRTDNRVDLVFEILEGGVAEIERINIVGNSAYSDRRLRRVLGTKQAGLLRALIRSDTFIQDRLAFDQQVLTDFYQSRGYVDFRVTGVNAELAEERDGYFVVFNVQEGQQFSFGEIAVNSDLPDVDPDEFADILRVRPGVIYSPSIVENSIARMERLANRKGLNFVRVEPRITRNDRDLTLDVEFNIVRGPRIFIERIDIEGNTTTLDRVVRRQFRVAEGDPFNPREIRESAERIRALGFFSNADVNAREGSSPDQVVIDVDVEEQPTGQIGFGGTFSSDDGFGANISFSERNFLGRGQLLNFGISTTSGAQAYSFSFAEPAFLGRDLRFGLSLAYRETDNQNDASFDTTRASFVPSLTFPVSEFGRLQVRYGARLDEMRDAGSDVGGIIRAEVDRGELWTSSVGYTYTYNTIGVGLDPNSGVRFTFGQEFAGLGGDVQSVRSTVNLTGETKVRNEEVTLRASLEGGMLATSGSDGSRTLDRFRLNSRQMRGFEPGGIGPRERGGDVNDALGGNAFAVARFEAEFPLGLPEEYGISGGLFYDVGNLWSLDSTDVGTAGTSVLYEEGSWRSVVGASIFWDTAIGPLRFNFTEALQAEKYDKTRGFEFTISTRF